MYLILVLMFAVLISQIAINFVWCKLETKKLHNNYGQFVEVHGEKMCVDISGKDDRVVVLLTGWASPSPVLEMASLSEKLKKSDAVQDEKYFRYVLEELGFELMKYGARHRGY